MKLMNGAPRSHVAKKDLEKSFSVTSSCDSWVTAMKSLRRKLSSSGCSLSMPEGGRFKLSPSSANCVEKTLDRVHVSSQLGSLRWHCGSVVRPWSRGARFQSR
ncbi:MAG: hypothetical protein ACI841_002652 [Planctomycetota bacterium]|jgi:hypothetical protein